MNFRVCWFFRIYHKNEYSEGKGEGMKKKGGKRELGLTRVLDECGDKNDGLSPPSK